MRKTWRLLFVLIAVPVLVLLGIAAYWQVILPDSFQMVKNGAITLPGNVKAVFREETTQGSGVDKGNERSADLVLMLGVSVKGKDLLGRTYEYCIAQFAAYEGVKGGEFYYLRLSLEDGDVAEGDLEESCSITSQRLCVKQFLNAHSDLGTNFQEFVDDGYSGTNMERPGIQRLLGMVEQGLVRTIVVRDLSRFARNYLEAGHYLEFIFPAYGVRFISINDHYDSDDYGENPAGLDLAIRNLINEMYSKDISRKIKSAVDLKKRSGEFVYGTAPFGYKKGETKNTIVVDDTAAITVKRIFKLASEGNTVTAIARSLNKDHVPSKARYNDELECKNVRADEEKIKGIILRAIQQQCSLTDVSLQEQKKIHNAVKAESEVVSDKIMSLQRRHVFVNEPQRGYAIFAENIRAMEETLMNNEQIAA